MAESLAAGTAITLTPGAMQHVRAWMGRQPQPERQYLRLGVMGGGCSGFSYVARLDMEPRESDVVIDQDGVRVLVDPKSLRILAGTVVDYDTTNLLEGGFRFDNPNAKRTCGCGVSFQLK